MKIFQIDVKSPSDNQLLLFGVPFVKGTFLEDDYLKLTLDEVELPLWYTVRNTWRDGDAYDGKAGELALSFRKSFEHYGEKVSDAVRKAGPVVE